MPQSLASLQTLLKPYDLDLLSKTMMPVRVDLSARMNMLVKPIPIDHEFVTTETSTTADHQGSMLC